MIRALIAWIARRCGQHMPIPPIRMPTQEPEPVQPLPAGVEATVSQRVITLNGFVVPEAVSQVRGVTLTSGHVIEQDVRAVLLLGDGSTTTDLRECSVCSLCHKDAQQALERAMLTPSQAMLASLCKRENSLRSMQSGVTLCPRHRCTVVVDGQPLMVSTEEAQLITRAARRKAIVRVLVSPFVEIAA